MKKFPLLRLFFIPASLLSIRINKEREVDEPAMADCRLFALGNSSTFFWNVPCLVQRFAAEARLTKKLSTYRMA